MRDEALETIWLTLSSFCNPKRLAVGSYKQQNSILTDSFRATLRQDIKILVLCSLSTLANTNKKSSNLNEGSNRQNPVKKIKVKNELLGSFHDNAYQIYHQNIP